MVDQSYTERIGNVLCDYVTPQFKTELVLQASQFSESCDQMRMGSSSSFLGGIQGTEFLDVNANVPSSTPTSDHGESFIPESTTNSQYIQDGTSHLDTNQLMSSACPVSSWTTFLPSTGLGQSRWYPNDLRKATVEPTDPQSYYNHVQSYSSTCSPRTSSLSSKGGLLIKSQSSGLLFNGNNQTVSDRWILAVFLSHHHREVFFPLPSWFSVRLFEDRSFTPEHFRKLRRIMNRKMNQENQSNPNNPNSFDNPPIFQSSGKSTLKKQDALSPTIGPTDNSDQPAIAVLKHSPVESSKPFEKQTIDESISIDSSTCSRRDSNVTSLGHLVPPPWTSSLDLWRRK